MRNTNLLIAALAGLAQALPQGPAGTPPLTTGGPKSITGPTDNTNLIKELRVAPTVTDRFKLLLTRDGKLLPDAELRKRTVFEFQNPSNSTTPASGLASITDFPILTNLGLAVGFGSIQPCGLIPPHSHPRATEFFTLLDGETQFGFLPEFNVVDVASPGQVNGHLDKYQGVAFPVGTVHFQINPTCKESFFTVTFSSEDPGIEAVAAISVPEHLEARDLEKYRRDIPATAGVTIEQCMKTCGIAKR